MRAQLLTRFAGTLALVAVASSAINARQQVAQPAARPAQPAPRDPGGERPLAVGKGTIAGTVVVAGSGQPARRARVNLSGGNEGGGNRSATTDDMGRFAFSALPEGRFNLSASKPGHIGGSYGQRQPGRPGTPIQLADGQRLEVQLQITRGSVITGTVLDEHGEAIPNTPVRALRYVMQSGQRTLQSSGSSQTDDRGMYRIYGLQPGEYLVYATPRNNNQGVEVARQAELQALMARSEAVQRLDGGAPQAQAIAERIGQLRQSAPDGSEEASSGYAPVYYPGTTAASSAAAITVGAGEEKGGIDFQYQVVPIARVEGIVTTTSSQVPPNIQISLVNSAASIPGISPGSTRADAQGNFRIPNVPPGQYTVIARATLGGPGREGGPGGRGVPPLGGRGEGPAGRGRGGLAVAASDLIRLWGISEVTVDGRNVANVALTLQPGMSVSGRIAFDGATPQPTDLTRMRVTLAPVIPPGVSGELGQAASGRIDADGRFTVTSVLPGKYRLSASGAGTGWFLGSASVEGQDSLDFPMEVKPSQNVTGAVVTFVDRQSELTGTIVNERSQPVPDFTLIVYPADQRYWIPQSRRIQSTRPATDGRFTFRNLPAGEYRIVPVYDPEPGSWYDPAFLQQLESASVRVSIAEGEKKEQHLRVPQ